MGRGRQKAKQTKVARQLKYFSPDTDYNALQRELAGGSNGHSENLHAEAELDQDDEAEDDEVDEDDDVDQYADWSPEPKR
jgi:hypothetical protein